MTTPRLHAKASHPHQVGLRSRRFDHRAEGVGSWIMSSLGFGSRASTSDDDLAWRCGPSYLGEDTPILACRTPGAILWRFGPQHLARPRRSPWQMLTTRTVHV